MKKEELLKKVDGLTDEIAEKVIEAFNGYIPKARFDEVNEAKKNAEALVKERDSQIESLKQSNKDNETLKNQIAELQESNKKAIEAKDAEIRKVQRDAIDNELIVGAKAKNAKAIRGLLDVIGDDVDIDTYRNKRSEQLEALKKSDEYLFDVQKPTNQKKTSGITPRTSDPDKKQGAVTKEQFAKMGYKARLELYNNDKELYDSLTNEE